jgi:hypothetical protein
MLRLLHDRSHENAFCYRESCLLAEARSTFIRINALIPDPTAKGADRVQSKTTFAMGSWMEAKAPRPLSAHAIMTIHAMTPNIAPTAA